MLFERSPKSEKNDKIFGGGVPSVSSRCHCSPLFDKFYGENITRSHLNWRWKLHYCSQVYLGLILATTKIPGMSKGEQGVKNHFKVINLVNIVVIH